MCISAVEITDFVYCMAVTFAPNQLSCVSRHLCCSAFSVMVVYIVAPVPRAKSVDQALLGSHSVNAEYKLSSLLTSANFR